MNSPKKVLYNIKKNTRYIEHSPHSSGIQTDSTSRISRSALKNITKLKISMKQKNIQKTIKIKTIIIASYPNIYYIIIILYHHPELKKLLYYQKKIY